MKSILTIILALFLSGNLFSQSLEQNIQEIRTQFKFINNQKDFTKIILENEEFTDHVSSEGASLEGYYKNGILYKIEEIYAVSNAVYTNQYYLKNNQLIFVYRTEKSYTPSEDETGIIKFNTDYEERIYYKDEKIIRHLEKGKSFSEKNTDFQSELKKLKPLLDTKVKFEKQVKLLQGSWRNTDNNNDWFEIRGLIKEQYYKADYTDTFRFRFEGQYIYFHSIEENRDFRYELIKLTDKSFEMKDRENGETEIYEKFEN